MSTRDKSLIDLFSPPDYKRVGVFGLVCGLSADENFMDAALEQFSGSRNQRRYNGHFSLALFLDAHNKPIQELPGLYNSWPKKQMGDKIRLMHAKVALLGFGKSATGIPDYYRLIVSTGNWTIEAVNTSINLIWCCDYDTVSEDNQKQSAKDIIEAVAFWRQLLCIDNNSTAEYYQVDGAVVKKRIEQFLKVISDEIPAPKRGYSPQFISNLLGGKAKKIAGYFEVDSMGAQVIKNFCDSGKRRNFIICGSGFFEQPDIENSAVEPEVIEKLVNHLKVKILTKDTEKWLVVNPKTCGAAGQWIKRNKTDDLDWVLCCPKHPDSKNTPADFHAKYVFIANYNESSDSLTSGLLYIGSGNLSKQGFKLGPRTGGNIEAGVIIGTERYGAREELCMHLGIDPKKFLTGNDIPDQFESEEFEQITEEFQIPPPITSCVWIRNTSKLVWRWADSDWNDVTLHGQCIQPPNCIEIQINEKDGDFSSGVKLSVNEKGKCHDWIIPVFNENNNFCCPPIQPKSGQEIVDALVAFPEYSYDDEDDDIDDESDRAGDGGRHVLTLSLNGDFCVLHKELDLFPLHFATTIVEAIADKNQLITEGQLQDWIEHLRRILIDEMKPEKKAQLMTLDSDILSPLIQTTGFAPRHPNEEYKKTIREIAENWGKTLRSL